MRRIDNPPNPYDGIHQDWLEPPPPAAVEVYEEAARSILSENDSPDLPFRWSVNPYRGCQHACSYCYARPYHEFLGLGAGTDFDTKLVVKKNAAELLEAAIAGKQWAGESINFSGVTDCYQPLEAVYRLTRACLEVCLKHRNRAVVVTKSYLVMRDADRLAALHRVAGAAVYQSIPFADDATAKLSVKGFLTSIGLGRANKARAAINLSEGGALLLAQEEIEVGTKVLVRIELERFGDVIEAEGVVAWSSRSSRGETDHYTGIRFDALAPEALKKIALMRECINSPEYRARTATRRRTAPPRT